MAKDFPDATNYNLISGNFISYAEVLDNKGKIIGLLTEAQLTRYWNQMEEFHTISLERRQK